MRLLTSLPVERCLYVSGCMVPGTTYKNINNTWYICGTDLVTQCYSSTSIQSAPTSAHSQMLYDLACTKTSNRTGEAPRLYPSGWLLIWALWSFSVVVAVVAVLWCWCWCVFVVYPDVCVCVWSFFLPNDQGVSMQVEAPLSLSFGCCCGPRWL